MAVTAPSNLKINQIYALNNGENSDVVQFPNAWLALEWTNGQTAPHNIVVETSHMSALSAGTTGGFLYANNPAARPLQSVLLPSGSTRGLIPLQSAVATYSRYDRFFQNQDAIIVRAYATTSTENSSVVSLAVPVHPSLLSVTTGNVSTNYVPSGVSVFDYWRLQGPYATVGSYSAVTAWMPGFPNTLTATASQLANSSVCVSFPFRGEIMHPTSAPGILIPVQDENHNEAHPLTLPKIYEIKLATLTGAEVHSGFAYPNGETGEVAYNIPASAVTQTGRYVLMARGLVQYYYPSYTGSVWNFSKTITVDQASPAGGGLSFELFNDNSSYSLTYAKTFANFTGTQQHQVLGTFIMSQVPTAYSMGAYGSASGVSVPAYRAEDQMLGVFNTESQLWSTVLTLTAPAVTSGGGGNTNMFSWLNNDYWYLTDLQVNLGTRAVTHRHGTLEIRPNDTVNFAVFFHDGSSGKDPVATDLRLAVRSSTNASAYYFWANPSVTTTSVSGDIYYTITVTASDEDLLSAQAAGLLAGSNSPQTLLAEVQWTTTRGTFTSDTFNITVANEVAREPDV